MRILSGTSPLSPKLKRQLRNRERILAAASAGVLSGILYTPVDLLTIQQQRLGKDLVGCFHHILQEHGPLGLLHGAIAMSLRESIFVMGMFGLTPMVTERLMKKFKGKQNGEMLSKLIGSAISGLPRLKVDNQGSSSHFGSSGV